MKIILVNSFWRPYIAGGAEITLMTLAFGLARRGHDVSVLTQCPGNGVRRYLDIDEFGAEVKVIQFPVRNVYWQFVRKLRSPALRFVFHLIDSYNIFLYTLLRRELRSGQYDVVACHNLMGISRVIWSVARSLDLPIVQVLHDYYLACPKTTQFRPGVGDCKRPCIGCGALRLGAKSYSGRLSAVVGVSQTIISTLANQGYFKGIPQHVIHNSRPWGAASPREFSGGCRFGYIGSLYRQKGVATLLESYAMLSAAMPTARISLTIAGKGDSDYEEQLKSMAAGKNIEFLGQVDSRAYFDSIDILIVPSEWKEPLGMVSVEALASGCPVIGSNSGGTTEIVIDGVNGELFAPGDKFSLNAVMRSVLSDPERWNRYARNARKSVEPFIDVDRMIGSYEDVFSKVCRK